MCPRCAADPRPANSDPRKCAFPDVLGVFSAENWRCATLEALLALGPDLFELDALSRGGRGAWFYSPSDEQCLIMLCDEERRGWLVLARYKARGRITSAVHVGDFPPRPVTLELVEETILWWEMQASRRPTS